MSDILLAPFSNSHIRDWPIGHWRALAGLLLERWTGDGLIRVVGTANQRMGANEIVRPHHPARVVNECGTLPWGELTGELARAALVVGNNSGVAHLAGHCGAPTVCVFGGSHQRLEWRPLGRNVAVVSRVIGCSPCQLDHGQVSWFDKACLRQIEPETVADAAFAVMARVAREEDGMRSEPAA